MTRVAVLGASGFVGATFVERLLARGRHEVRPLIHSAGSAWRLSRHGLALRTVELLSPAQLRAAIEGCTHVVNCSYGSRAVALDGLRNLLEVCRTAGVERFVHLSSVAVYGEPAPPESVHEDAPTRPAPESYGWTKLRQDEMIQDACRRGLPSVILCPPYISGAYSRFLVRIVAAIEEGRFVLVDAGERVCNLVDVQNLAQAIELALSCPQADAQRMFVTDDEPTTWRQVAEALAPLAAADRTLPTISLEEAGRFARSGDALQVSALARLKRLAGSREIRDLLRDDPTAKRVYQAAQALGRFLPQSIQTRMKSGATPSVKVSKVVAQPGHDAHLCRLQLRTVRHSCDRAATVLGYRPEVSVSRSMEAFRSWYELTHGWGSDFAPLFRELCRPSAPVAGAGGSASRSREEAPT